MLRDHGDYIARGHAIESSVGDYSTCQWYEQLTVYGPYGTEHHVLPKAPPELREVIYKNDLSSVFAMRKESSLSERVFKKHERKKQKLSCAIKRAENMSLIDNIEQQISEMLPLY